MKNQRYGEDPIIIDRYARRIHKLSAVFEAGAEEREDSWKGKSVEAEADASPVA